MRKFVLLMIFVSCGVGNNGNPDNLIEDEIAAKADGDEGYFVTGYFDPKIVKDKEVIAVRRVRHLRWPSSTDSIGSAGEIIDRLDRKTGFFKTPHRQLMGAAEYHISFWVLGTKLHSRLREISRQQGPKDLGPVGLMEDSGDSEAIHIALNTSRPNRMYCEVTFISENIKQALSAPVRKGTNYFWIPTDSREISIKCFDIKEERDPQLNYIPSEEYRYILSPKLEGATATQPKQPKGN